MATKVVVHSNAKRLVQVIGAAILIAASLTGIKRLAAWRNAIDHPVPAASAALANANANATGSAGDIMVGRSIVIDADTLEIRGAHIRLEGVDGPEAGQRCGTVGQEWACGRQAAMALSDWLGERTVSCRAKGEDRYKRTLARCFVGTEDVQAWLVLNGWALAYRQYSQDYVAAEEVAQSRKSGIWRDQFVAPWVWRQQRE